MFQLKKTPLVCRIIYSIFFFNKSIKQFVSKNSILFVKELLNFRYKNKLTKITSHVFFYYVASAGGERLLLLFSLRSK